MNKTQGLRFFIVLFVIGVLAIGYQSFYARSFNPEKIVANSILKDKNFETNVIEIVSDKGIKAYLFEDKNNPIISIDFMFKNSGTAYDRDGFYGISNMVSALLTEGSGDLDNSKFKEELELSAISVSFSSDIDDFSGSLVTTVENKDKAYKLLNSALTNPRFDKEDVNLTKSKFLFALRSQTERPERVLGLEFIKNIYGEHPYSHNPVGEAEDIAKISKKDMLEFIKKNLTLDRLIVGISGDISPEEAKKAIDIIFAGLEEKSVEQELAPTYIDFNGRNIEIERKSSQNNVIFANQSVARTDIDFYPLYVVNYIFGDGGLNSRLSLKARENEGLTYGIYSSLYNNLKSNMLRGGFSATPENYPRVVEIIKEEWQKMGQDGVSEKELNAAKNYLIASYNLRFASISNISYILAYMQRYDLGIDFLQKRNEYVSNVNLDDANRVARKYFDNDNLIFMAIGTFNKNEVGENK